MVGTGCPVTACAATGIGAPSLDTPLSLDPCKLPPTVHPAPSMTRGTSPPANVPDYAGLLHGTLLFGTACCV